MTTEKLKFQIDIINILRTIEGLSPEAKRSLGSSLGILNKSQEETLKHSQTEQTIYYIIEKLNEFFKTDPAAIHNMCADVADIDSKLDFTSCIGMLNCLFGDETHRIACMFDTDTDETLGFCLWNDPDGAKFNELKIASKSKNDDLKKLQHDYDSLKGTERKLRHKYNGLYEEAKVLRAKVDYHKVWVSNQKQINKKVHENCEEKIEALNKKLEAVIKNCRELKSKAHEKN